MTGVSVLRDNSAVEESLAKARTLPYSWYTDPGVLATERERVFNQYWLYLGHVGQVANPGDFFTVNVNNIPVVVTRDTSGDIHTLVNVCRHRGAEVIVEPKGNCRALQCHYHAWTYGLDGRLVSAPRSRQEPGFDKGDFPLRRVRTEVYGPFIFGTLNDEAPTLTEYLGEMPAIVERTGIRLDALRHRERREYLVKANWKIVVENFLECYHCTVAHPTFADVVDLDTYFLEEFEYFSTQGAPATEAYGGTDQQVREGRYNYLWPSFMLNIYPGPGNVSTNVIIPVDHETTLAVYDFFYEEAVSAEDEKAVTDLINLVMEEDIVLCESVQRGVASGVYEQGKLMTTHEHAVAHFQRLVNRSLAR
jgi:phenylpropionate dioxygenase-like ring-hydroxylating dioxygenase large terminal subunit